MALIICPECQKNISDKAKACPHCGYLLNDNKLHNKKKNESKKHIGILLGVVCAIIGGIYLYSYIQQELANQRVQEYLQEMQREEEKWEAMQASIREEILADLVISDVDGYNNNKIKGKLTNNSSYTVTYVKVKFVFKKHGEIVDTDWTYAVSSEGLAPGETTEFYTYNDNWAKNITATVIDFNYK